MIKRETDTKKTLLTIVNYNNFQSSRDKNGTVTGQSRDSDGTVTDTNKKYKNIKNFKNGENSARARKPSTWNNLESEERKKQRDDFLDEFQKHIVGG